MNTVEDWLVRYSHICESLLCVLGAEPGGYSDEKLESVESAIETRREMLEELSVFRIEESQRASYAPKLQAIRDMELEIESQVRAMMAELQEKLLTVKDQRSELNRLKKANRSYVGVAKSTEGYFIDKKK